MIPQSLVERRLQNQGKPIVRQFRRSDLPNIAEVHLASAKEAYKQIYPTEVMQGLTLEGRLDLWNERVAQFDELTRIWIAEHEEELLGFCITRPALDTANDNDTFEIYRMYVKPSRFRSGIGRELLEWATSDLRTRGCRKIVLWTIVNNTPAKLFYQAAGFADDHATRHMERVESGVQVRYDEMRYAKALC